MDIDAEWVCHACQARSLRRNSDYAPLSPYENRLAFRFCLENPLSASSRPLAVGRGEAGTMKQSGIAPIKPPPGGRSPG